MRLGIPSEWVSNVTFPLFPLSSPHTRTNSDKEIRQPAGVEQDYLRIILVMSINQLHAQAVPTRRLLNKMFQLGDVRPVRE